MMCDQHGVPYVNVHDGWTSQALLIQRAECGIPLLSVSRQQCVDGVRRGRCHRHRAYLLVSSAPHATARVSGLTPATPPRPRSNI